MGDSSLHGAPYLARAYLTEVKVRRQPRRTGKIRPIPHRLIVHNRLVKKLHQPRLTALLARRPGGAQSCRPSGFG
jgi:hypothetical protein